MAVGAGRPFPRMSAGVDREPGVVERCSRPCSGRVTRQTGCREVCCYVVRVAHSRVVSLVARVAVSGRSGEDIVHVTLGAGNVDVCSGEGERRFAVIESRWSPRRGCVADLAGRREPSGTVVRISRGVVFVLVTRNACVRRDGEVAVDVTLRAQQ